MTICWVLLDYMEYALNEILLLIIIHWVLLEIDKNPLIYSQIESFPNCLLLISFINVYIYIYIYIIIIIIIMSCRQHGYPWLSLTTSPYHSSPPAGLQGYILCPHIAAVCKFELVVLLLLWTPTYSHIYIYIYIYIYIWRCPWCIGYRHRKCTRRHEFKSWTRLIAFHIGLIPLRKVWIQLLSLQLWVK